MGNDQGYAQGRDGVLPSSGATDHGDDGETQGRRRVGVTIGRGGNGSRGSPPHRGVHQEVSDDHSGEGGLPPYLCTMHRGGAGSGDDPVGVMVISRRGK